MLVSNLTMLCCSLVPRPLFSVFIFGDGKKGLVDLRRNFRSTRPTDFGGR